MGERDPKTLYVIFHGAIALYQTDSSILALIADMGSDHQYLAGSWLAEQELERGSVHVLTGVKTGTDQFKNTLFPSADVDCTGHHCDAMGSMTTGNAPYAVLQFPLPDQAIEMFPVVVKGGSIQVDDESGNPQPIKDDVPIPFTPVLQYTVNGAPRLGSHWPGAGIDASSEADLPYRTLHVYAENPVPLGRFRRAHISTAFTRACGLISKTASFTNKLTACLPKRLPDLPYGLEQRIFEFQPLALRIQALHQLGLSKQRCPGQIDDPWENPPSVGHAYCRYFKVGCPEIGEDITCIPPLATSNS